MKLPNIHLKRKSILFVLGLLGIANEAQRNGTERPTLLILYAGMVGLPAFLKADEKIQEHTPVTPPIEPTPTPPEEAQP